MGAHFKALNEAVLMALAKILEIFFPFRVSQPLCALHKNARLFAYISCELQCLSLSAKVLLICYRFILTAAHCLSWKKFDPKKKTIVGSNVASRYIKAYIGADNCRFAADIYNITKPIFHPEYRPACPKDSTNEVI